MKIIFKILGGVWILASVLIAYYILTTATKEISQGFPEDAPIFWPVIIFIFLPILVGLALFGVYSLQGEYDDA